MRKQVWFWSLVLLIGVSIAGCGDYATKPGEEQAAEPPAEAAAEAVPEAAPAIEMTAELTAQLSGADLVDGAEDHVVSRCPGCAFGMEGSDQHAVQVGDYSLHFCSADCKEAFEKDVTASVIAMALPQADAPAEHP